MWRVDTIDIRIVEEGKEPVHGGHPRIGAACLLALRRDEDVFASLANLPAGPGREPSGPGGLPSDTRLSMALVMGVVVTIVSVVEVANVPLLLSASLAVSGMSVVMGMSTRAGMNLAAGILALVVAVAAGHQLVIGTLGLPSGPPLGLADLPGRLSGGMAPSLALSLLAFGLSQAWVCLTPGLPNALALVAGGLVCSGIGLVALAGHLLGIPMAYEWRGTLAMTTECAFCLWLLGAAHLMVAWHPRLQVSSLRIFLVAALATPAGYLFDLSTPPQVGATFIYIPSILSAIWFTDRRAAFSLATACGLLTLVGYAAKVDEVSGGEAGFAARLLLVTTEFIVAGLVYVYKQATDLNRRARLRFDALMENSPDAVVTTDAVGTILQTNRGVEKVLGYTSAELLGRNVRVLMPEPYHSAHDGYMQRYAATLEKRIIGAIREVVGKHKDGTTLPLDLLVTELPSGGQIEYVGILRDLSVRKRQEENLRHALARLGAYTADLERSNRELDDFAYIASHDLKEPLRGIHNHSRFLLEDYHELLDQDGKRRLDRLVHLSQRMEKLVNDLLYFSRIGRSELAMRPTDIAAVLADIVSTLEQFLEERHAKVFVHENLPEISCDAVRVAEVFRNLIVNAVKYNDKPEKQIEVGILAKAIDRSGKERSQVFFCRDNGKGIAQEFYDDIFRMFKRLERTEEDGTGAGLTFVRKIVQRHGGNIWLESEPGRGTTFFFTLAPE